MRYVAAYMLAVMGGNPDPSAEDLINILASVGVEVDLENLNRVIKELKGNDLEEVAEKGKLYTSWKLYIHIHGIKAYTDLFMIWINFVQIKSFCPCGQFGFILFYKFD